MIFIGIVFGVVLGMFMSYWQLSELESKIKELEQNISIQDSINTELYNKYDLSYNAWLKTANMYYKALEKLRDSEEVFLETIAQYEEERLNG